MIASTLAGSGYTPLSVSLCPMKVKEEDLNWIFFVESRRSSLLLFSNRLVRFLSWSISASSFELPHPKTHILSASSILFRSRGYPKWHSGVAEVTAWPLNVVSKDDSSSRKMVWKASERIIVNTFALVRSGSFLKLSELCTWVFGWPHWWSGWDQWDQCPFGFSFFKMFEIQSVGCVTDLMMPTLQSLSDSSLILPSFDTGTRCTGGALVWQWDPAQCAWGFLEDLHTLIWILSNSAGSTSSFVNFPNSRAVIGFFKNCRLVSVNLQII